MKGKVYLVGAGPGDPGLLTVKGRQLLSRADVIIYDALIDRRVLQGAKLHAKKIFVGILKGPNLFKKRQERIDSLFKKYARLRKVIVRLKGGDPFLFGRGGEDALFLRHAGIPFEVVPGVTSAIAVPASAGIPLTMRKINSMVTIVTGHERKGGIKGDTSGVDWAGISPRSTLVILMGISKIKKITSNLIRHHWFPNTPAAVIRYGTWPQQKTIKGTLGNIADKVKKAKLTSPAVIIIGEVVRLGDLI